MFFGVKSTSKPKKLVLHIGMHKTGSTAIQSSMSASNKYLLSKGINYLSGIRMNHGTTFVSLFGDEPHKYHVNVQNGVNTPKKAAFYNKRLEKQVLYKIKRNQSNIFVISGEGLSILPEAGVKRLQGFMAPHFDDIEVVCYIRRPLEFYKSMCQQYIVGGRPKEQLAKNPPLPEYRFRLEKYAKIFGEENLVVKLFDREQLFEGSVVADFLVHLGLDTRDLKSIAAGDNNESLTHTGVEIINAINERIPAFKNNSVNPARGDFIRRAFVKAGADSDDARFEFPFLYEQDHLESVNQDIGYVNGFLKDGQKVEKITSQSMGNATHDSPDINIAFVANLVNELQLVAGRRQARIRSLRRKLYGTKIGSAIELIRMRARTLLGTRLR